MLVGRGVNSVLIVLSAFLPLAFLGAIGCETAVPAFMAYEYVKDQLEGDDEGYPGSDEGKPAPPVIVGPRILTAPCEFSAGLASSDVDGHVVDFRQTGGVLPPEYSFVIENNNPENPNVSARLKGPPVDPGSWESFVVAVDNDGKESHVKSVALTCQE